MEGVVGSGVHRSVVGNHKIRTTINKHLKNQLKSPHFSIFIDAAHFVRFNYYCRYYLVRLQRVCASDLTQSTLDFCRSLLLSLFSFCFGAINRLLNYAMARLFRNQRLVPDDCRSSMFCVFQQACVNSWNFILSFHHFINKCNVILCIWLCNVRSAVSICIAHTSYLTNGNETIF